MPFRELAVLSLGDSRLKYLYGRIFGSRDLHGFIRWRVFRKLLDPRAASTLDVGTSVGPMAFELAKLQRKAGNDRGQILGIDIDPDLIRQANVVKERYGFSECAFEVKAIDEVENERYEQVLLLDVLEHVQDDGAFLRECVRKVQKGGRFVISVPTPDYPVFFDRTTTYRFIGHVRDGYTLAQMTDRLRELGLSVERELHYCWVVAGVCCWFYYRFALFRSKALEAILRPPLILLSKFDWIRVRPSSLVVVARKPPFAQAVTADRAR